MIQDHDKNVLTSIQRELYNVKRNKALKISKQNGSLTLCVREPAIDGMTRSKYHNLFKQL